MSRPEPNIMNPVNGDMKMANFASEIAPENISSQPTIIRRRIYVEISGTMSNFKVQGETAATWKPREDKHPDVFGLTDAFENGMDYATSANVLKNAMMRKVTMLEYKNTFPVTLGVSISCLTPDEAAENGDRFVATALPTCTNSTPQVIYETDGSSIESVEWRKRYPQYNESNLQSEGVLEIKHQPYVFVDKDHPAIEMMRLNKELLNANIDDHELFDSRYYKVTKQLMSTLCNTLRTKVLDKVTYRDLNSFQIQLHRLNRKAWDKIGKEDLDEHFESPEQAKNKIQQLLVKPHKYMARLELEYEIQT